MLKVDIRITLTTGQSLEEVKRKIESGLREIGSLNAPGSKSAIAEVKVVEDKTVWSGAFNNNTGTVQ